MSLSEACLTTSQEQSQLDKAVKASRLDNLRKQNHFLIFSNSEGARATEIVTGHMPIKLTECVATVALRLFTFHQPHAPFPSTRSNTLGVLILGPLVLYAFVVAMGSSGSKAAPLEAQKAPVPGGANALMGYWYVQGLLPNYFEKGAHNSLEQYEWTDEAAGKLKVTYKYRTGSFTAKESVMRQDGKIHNAETGADWRVKPYLLGMAVPTWLPFLVIETVPDQYMVVGYPDRSYLWIMARQPILDEEVYQGAVKRCKEEHGYDVSTLYRVPQQWGDDHPRTVPASS